MERHFKELESHMPDLLDRPILDLGAGKGSFMIEIANRGGDVVGIEPYDRYVEIIKERGRKMGINLRVERAFGEQIPFADEVFGFVNMNEVIEHTEDPEKVMKEVFRVLKKPGFAYISIPNRHGFKDQHFNLYLVNWLPRKLANTFISIFSKHKDYSIRNGRQRLDQMHYYRYGQIKKMLQNIGFSVTDLRESKINKRLKNKWVRALVMYIYSILKFAYFDSFHVAVKK